MEGYAIKGGSPLTGEVVIGGAKNAALGILAAAIMTDDVCLIDNMPDVNDTNVLLEAMKGIGAQIDRTGNNEVSISGAGIDAGGEMLVDNEYIRKIRASYYLIGALLGKYKKAKVVLPGGCAIGKRPIDQHLKGFSALGAEVEVTGDGYVVAKAEKLTGCRIYLDVVSVGATINIMMAAAMAEGNTIIENAAKEPHIVDVANFLNSMGAKVRGAGTDVIRIQGVEKLHGTEYSIIPDQIEAGTFMMAAAATNGDVIIRNVIPKHLETISTKLIEIGAVVEESDDAVRVCAGRRLKHTQVITQPYPGFPTDMQPQITVTLGLSKGTSIVTESIFENRFRYTEELNKMGGNVTVVNNRAAIINGVKEYRGAKLVAPDLRAGAALVIAALAAKGNSTITDIHFIQRGYERFEEKIQGLGGKIIRFDSEEEAAAFFEEA